MTARRPRIGVLHRVDAAASVAEIVRAARPWADPVFVFHAPTGADRALVSATERLSETVIVDNDADFARLGLDGLTTFHDDEIDLTESVSAALDLPTALPVDRPWDKLRQRTVGRAAGLGRVEAVAVDSAADLRDAARSVGLPGVLKPRRGAGGRGVVVVRDAADLDGLQADLDGCLFESWIEAVRHPCGEPWRANFASVEMASDDCGHHPVAIFDKLPVATTIDTSAVGESRRILVCGDVYPTVLPPQRRAELVAVVRAALDALGVRWRLTHTEVMFTPDGYEILEINGRMGGDLNRLLHLAAAPDMVGIALGLAVRRAPRLPADGGPAHVLGFYPPFADRAGAVASQVRAADVRTLPGVVGVHRVAAHGAARADTRWRAVDVTLRTGDRAALDRTFRAAAARVREMFAADRIVLPGDPCHE